MKAKRFSFIWFYSVLLVGALLTFAAPASIAGGGDQSSLVIAYRVVPANRSAFRHELATEGLRQFQQWKSEGVLDSYRIFFSRYADSDNWDALALLSFPSSTELDRWKLVEQFYPAGLTSKALALTSSIQTTPVSLARNKRATVTTANSVFMVIPYVTMVSTGDYLKYADAYMNPQFDGMMAESVMAGYDLLVATYSAGRSWSSLVILEYKDQESLSKREGAEARVRGRLKDQPEWKAFSDVKKSIREEKQIVLAEQLGQP